MLFASCIVERGQDGRAPAPPSGYQRKLVRGFNYLLNFDLFQIHVASNNLYTVLPMDVMIHQD